MATSSTVAEQIFLRMMQDIKKVEIDEPHRYVSLIELRRILPWQPDDEIAVESIRRLRDM